MIRFYLTSAALEKPIVDLLVPDPLSIGVQPIAQLAEPIRIEIFAFVIDIVDSSPGLIRAVQSSIASDCFQGRSQVLHGRVIIDMDERMRRSDACVILSRRSAHHGNDAERECAPELLGDVVRARLRFEGEIELRCAQVEFFTGRLPTAAGAGLNVSVERERFVRRDAFAEGGNGIVLAE